MSTSTLGTRLPEAVVTADLAEDVLWLLDGGESVAEVCRRVGHTPDALNRRFHRSGRRDLAARFAFDVRVVRNRRESTLRAVA